MTFLISLLLFFGFNALINCQEASKAFPFNFRELKENKDKLTCPQDYERRGSDCYKVFTNKLTFDEAEVICVSGGGHLTSVDGATTNEFISEIIRKKDGNIVNYWIGYHRQNVDNSSPKKAFHVSGKQTETSIGYWGPGQPNINKGECVKITYENEFPSWNFAWCGEKLPFVCMKPACVSDHFYCAKAGKEKCIKNEFLCDGKDDCGDLSDELLDNQKCRNRGVTYIRNSENGEIKSPNYPSLYGNLQELIWIIEGPIGRRVQFKFNDLQTESGFDVVDIWLNGNTYERARFAASLSGIRSVDQVPTFISDNNFMIIRFTTDSSIAKKGFRGTWTSTYKCEMKEKPNYKQATNILTEVQGTDKNGCIKSCESKKECHAITFYTTANRCVQHSSIVKPVPNESSDETAYWVKTCPGIHGEASLDHLPGSGDVPMANDEWQYIMSPFYPLNYPSNIKINWLIKASQFSLITIQILDVQLGEKDKLIIKNGGSSSSQTLVSLDSKSKANDLIVITTANSAYIYLDSESENTNSGFQIKYKIGCDVELTGKSGSIQTPGFGIGDYPSLQTCKWKINTANPFTVKFPSANFRLGNGDYLKIFRGLTESDSAVHSGDGYSGLNSPNDIIVTGGKLLIKFTSDATIDSTGFKASYSIDCPDYTRDSETIITGGTYKKTFGSKFTVACRSSGYYFSAEEFTGKNSVELECEIGGKWSVNRLPQCSRRYCGHVPEVNNGYVDKITGVLSGDTATYKCFPGFSITPSTNVVCNSNGQWGTSPKCQSQNCPPRGAPPNSELKRIHGEGFEYGTVLTATCLEGYEYYKGNHVIYCQSGGTWSGELPACRKKKCPISKIPNGKIDKVGDFAEFDDTLIYSCEDGFRLNGTSQLKCKADQTIGPLPFCEDVNECEGSHGCQQMCENTIGSFTCKCREGYQIDQKNGKTCLDKKECEVNNGGCSKKCDEEDGSYKCDCDDASTLFIKNGQNGFNIRTNRKETGLMNGDIYRLNHTCIPNECTEPIGSSFNNGNIFNRKDRYYVGDAVNYECNLGYQFSDGKKIKTRTCRNDGTWDESVPVCNSARCDALSLPNDIINKPINPTPTGSVAYGSKVTWDCDLSRLGKKGVIVKRSRTCAWDTANGDSSKAGYRLVGDDYECGRLDCGDPGVLIGFSGTKPTNTEYLGTFTFSCKTGYTKTGESSKKSDIVECESDGHWGLNTLKCEGPTCTDPGTPPEATQHAISYEEGQIVTYTCKRKGYLPVPSHLQCVFNGGTPSWNDTNAVSCQDKEAPKFLNCENDQVKIVDRLDTLSLSKPQVTDNSGAVKDVSLKTGSLDINAPVKQDSVVTWVATDHAGNTAECRVSVKIRQNSAVKIEGCPGHQTETVNSVDEERKVTTKEAEKITGHKTISREPAVIDVNFNNIGKVFTVVITAKDESENVAQCKYQYLIESGKCAGWALRTPKNGVKNCPITPGGTQCTMTCNSGFVFPDATTKKVYSCQSGNSWDIGNKVPDCVKPEQATYRQEIQLIYKPSQFQLITDNCAREYLSVVRSKKSNIESTADNQGHCSSVTVKMPSSVDEAIKGQVIVSNFYVTLTWDISPFEKEKHLKDRCATLTAAFLESLVVGEPGFAEYLAEINPSPSSGCLKLSLDTEVKFPEDHGYACPAGKAKENLCIPCSPGYKSVNGECVECPKGSFQELVNKDDCMACPNDTSTYDVGSFSRDDCKPVCERGMISTTKLPPCKQCPVDHYWVSPEKCEPCPADTTTEGETGAKSIDECRARCKAGEFSVTGRAPCKKCPKGFYQNLEGSTSCAECNSDETTASEGTEAQSGCLSAATRVCQPNPCLNGNCNVQNHRAVCSCQPGWTGDKCEKNIDDCASNPCFYDGKCVDLPNDYRCECKKRVDISFEEKANQVPTGSDISAYDSRQGQTREGCQKICREEDICNYSLFQTGDSRCILFKGTSTTFVVYANSILSVKKRTETDAYTGKSCETERNDCLNNQCKNGGMCQDLNGDYKCLCLTTSTFTGDFCEISREICDRSPCKNGGTCVKLSDFRRKCQCVPGYVGRDCEKEIDECASNPCMNGGKCKNNINGFTCECNDRFFSGTRCETRKPNPCNVVTCSGRGTCVEDYQNSATRCICQKGYRSDYRWTEWFDKSTPVNSDRDDERFVANDVCQGTKPLEIRCRDTKTKKKHTETGDILEIPCTLDGGLFCLNSNQTNNKTCSNYEVRYKCSITEERGGISDCVVDDECVDDPCVQGECKPRPGEEPPYICGCPTGFYGSNCQHETNECDVKPCRNGGKCTDLKGGYKCDCPNGFEGFDCERERRLCDLNPCKSDSTVECKNTVNDYECVCLGGFKGKNCTEEILECESSPCLNDASCKELPGSGYQCTCPVGYEGKNCEKMKNNCNDDTCKRDSVCYNVFNGFHCACKPGTFGNTCSDGPKLCDQANPCRNQGTCSVDEGKAVCNCTSSFTGAGCEREKDYCGSNSVCQNGGICSLTDNGYNCECLSGFTGTNCEVNIDDCRGIECNGGKCIDGVNEYFCRCNNGVVGSDCSKQVDRAFDIAFLRATKDSGAVSPVPFKMGKKMMTLAVYVRYLVSGDTGNFLTLYSSKSDITRELKEKLLQIDHSGLTFFINNGDRFMPFSNNVRINDGQWHYIVITFDSVKAIANLYVDAEKVTDLQSYSPDFIFPENGIIRIGDKYDINTKSAAVNDGLLGYVSLVQFWNRELNGDEIRDAKILGNSISSNLIRDISSDWSLMNVESGASRLSGTGRLKKVCPPDRQGSDCKDDNVRFGPTVESCPTDIIKTGSDRLVSVTWNEPKFTRSSEKSFNYVNGQVFTFGTYQVLYVARDKLNNVAICKFKIFVRRGDCVNPAAPLNGLTPTRTAFSTLYFNTEAKCSASYYPLVPSPQFYTCGPLGTFNLKDPWNKFVIPPCGSIGTKSITLTAEWSYQLGNCDSSAQSTLESMIQSEIKRLHIEQNQKGEGLCNADNNCGNADVDVTCDGKRANVKLEIKNSLQFIGSTRSTLTLNKAAIQDGYFVTNAVVGGDKILSDSFKTETVISCPEFYHKVDDECVQCTKGYSYDATNKACKPCEIGFYTDSASQTACSSCGTGRTTAARGTTSQTNCISTCSPGQFYSLIEKRCKPCEKGYYQPQSGKTYCLPCVLGKTTDGDGKALETDCIDKCDSGEWLQPDGTCKKCPIGTFRNKNDAELLCQQCPAGRTSKEEGAKSSSDCSRVKCLLGSIRQGDDPGVCTPCPKGEFRSNQNADTVCEKCPEKTTTENIASIGIEFCKPSCPAGKKLKITLVGSTNITSCDPCPLGMYKTEEEPFAEICRNCPGNKPDTPFPGATSASACSYGNCTIGQIVDPNTKNCKICPPGTFQPIKDHEPGKVTCQPCGDGKTTKNQGSTSSDNCERFCKSGEEQDFTSSIFSCRRCPRGTYKDATIDNTDPSSFLKPFTNCTQCKDGFTTLSDGSTRLGDCTIVACKPGEYRKASENKCFPCEKGKFQSEKWQDKCEDCPTHYTTKSTGATSQSDCNQVNNGQRFIFDVVFTDTFNSKLKHRDTTEFKQFEIKVKEMLKPSLSTFGSFMFMNIIRFESGSTLALVESYFDKNKSPPGENQLKVAIDKTLSDPKNSPQLRTTSVAPRITNTICDKGQYISIQGVCFDCLQGQYQPDNAPDTCIECDSGYDTDGQKKYGKAEDVCLIKCPPGQKRQGSGKCIPCGIGYYKAGTSITTECTACSTINIGQITEQPDATSSLACFKECPKGKFAVGGFCQDCPPDTYKNNTKQKDCVKCRAGYKTTSIGQQEETDCKEACSLQGDSYCNNHGKCVPPNNPSNWEPAVCKCDSDYKGDTCDTLRDDNQTAFIIGGTIGGVAGLLLIVLAVIAIFSYRRWKRIKSGGESSDKKQLNHANGTVAEEKAKAPVMPIGNQGMLIAPVVPSTPAYSPMGVSGLPTNRGGTPSATLVNMNRAGNQSFMFYEERDSREIPDLQDFRSVSQVGHNYGYDGGSSATFFAKK